MTCLRVWRRWFSFVRGWALLALPLTLFGLGISPALAQSGDNRAGLVIVHGDGRVLTRCVAFSETQITGLDLLQRSGLPFVSASGPLGVTVCALNGEGCPASDCFCMCKGTPCAYWTYFLGTPEGGWVYANMGASMRQVRDGDVDAWVWGDGQQRPASVSFEAICGGVVPTTVTTGGQVTPEPTVEPSLTPTPIFSPTPTPTASIVASPTAGPTPGTETPEPIPSSTWTPRPSPIGTAAVTSPVASRTPDEVMAPSSPTPTGAPSTHQVTDWSSYISFIGALALIGVAWLAVRYKVGGR